MTYGLFPSMTSDLPRIVLCGYAVFILHGSKREAISWAIQGPALG